MGSAGWMVPVASGVDNYILDMPTDGSRVLGSQETAWRTRC